MYVSKEKDAAVVMAYSFEFHGRDRFLEFKLDGLEKDKKYKLTELNPLKSRKPYWGEGMVFTGDELMKVGININDSEMFDSFVFLLTAVDE